MKVTDENSKVRKPIRIRIRQSEVRIHGSGSVPKCHGSATLQKSVTKLSEIWSEMFRFIADPDFSRPASRGPKKHRIPDPRHCVRQCTWCVVCCMGLMYWGCWLVAIMGTDICSYAGCGCDMLHQRSTLVKQSDATGKDILFFKYRSAPLCTLQFPVDF